MKDIMQKDIRLEDVKILPIVKELEVEDPDKLFDWAYHTENNPDASRLELENVIYVYELFRKRGWGMAANNLGSMYYNGIYFEEDRLKALEYYEEACEMGCQLAYSNLAYCYYYGGNGVKVDYRKAFRYFSEGANLFNDPNCLYKVGDMYRFGKYVEENDNKAFQMYVRALNACNKDSDRDFELQGDIRYRLGDCFLHGIGCEIDALEALWNLCHCLPILYRRLGKDKYVENTIKKANRLLKEAEKELEVKKQNFA